MNNNIKKLFRVFFLLFISANCSGAFATDWTSVAKEQAPGARAFHTAVWTGSKMIVWGGTNNSGVLLDSGKIYNPATDSWDVVSSSGAPSPRAYHTAVWTGSKMIVWGGNNFTEYLKTGSIYDPTLDTWVATSLTNAPNRRSNHTAVWTDQQMIIWGGMINFDQNTKTGGIYSLPLF